jgi:choline dehydrogenase-like flavoprotein
MMPWQVPHRGAGEDGRVDFGGMKYGFFEAPNGYWQIPGEPYTVAAGNQFDRFRSADLGGRTDHYGRVSLRFADYDFKPRSMDGLGADWPISYWDDLAPWYDKAEAFIGVHGTREGIRSAPDGIFQPGAGAPRPRDDDSARRGQAWHAGDCGAQGDDHQGAQRARGVPLLRPLRRAGALRRRLTLRARCRSSRR